jgi:hypothetical protein
VLSFFQSMSERSWFSGRHLGYENPACRVGPGGGILRLRGERLELVHPIPPPDVV